MAGTSGDSSFDGYCACLTLRVPLRQGGKRELIVAIVPMQISKTSVSRFSDFICPAILLLIAIAIAYPRWRAGIDWRDEGLLAYGAERVVHGEIPHRDFVSLQPPLSFYTAAVAFKLGGTSLATLRVFG